MLEKLLVKQFLESLVPNNSVVHLIVPYIKLGSKYCWTLQLTISVPQTELNAEMKSFATFELQNLRKIK